MSTKATSIEVLNERIKNLDEKFEMFVESFKEFKSELTEKMGMIQTNRTNYDLLSEKCKNFDKRVRSLESDRKWALRIVLATIITAALAFIGLEV